MEPRKATCGRQRAATRRILERSLSTDCAQLETRRFVARLFFFAFLPFPIAFFFGAFFFAATFFFALPFGAARGGAAAFFCSGGRRAAFSRAGGSRFRDLRRHLPQRGARARSRGVARAGAHRCSRAQCRRSSRQAPRGSPRQRAVPRGVAPGYRGNATIACGAGELSGGRSRWACLASPRDEWLRGLIRRRPGLRLRRRCAVSG